MRKLSGGDVEARLARIEKDALRGRKWRKRARAHLLRDQCVTADREGVLVYRLVGHRGNICSKLRFPTRRTARKALMQAIANPDPRRREIRAYRCTECKGYHLTSKEYVGHGHHEENIGKESPDG